ncbi:YbaB/EbfC family nucleoid-associated protein [Solihabitans fulvus]|uniref:YbaB/EbfC family nucleoid-associated protein n=1 Tax=Solihabitans fulvus TaxID=1892852 RepID=UPI0016621B97|nr:YbaB/EbfC family nucleoid-associated protein [Solihabitans fulvus]
MDSERALDPQQWLGDLQKRVDAAKLRAEQLKEGVAASTVTAASPDGAVTVTVGPNGGLTNISLSQRAAEHPPTKLGSLIMQTVGTAQRQAATRVAEALAATGASQDTMAFVGSFLPPPPDPEPSGAVAAAQVPPPVSSLVPAKATAARRAPARHEDENDEIELNFE